MCVFSSDNFGQLYRVVLQRNKTQYTLPQGELRPYFSFSSFANRVLEAQVTDNSVVRHTSVANKWKTVHLLLLPGSNATQIHYNLTFQGAGDQEFTMSFTVAVDTRELPKPNVSDPVQEKENKELKPTVATPEPEVVFADIPVEQQAPRVRKKPPGEVVVVVPALNTSLLPKEVKHELQRLDEKLLLGDITMKGYNLTKAKLLRPFQDRTNAGDDKTDEGKAEEGGGAVEKDIDASKSGGKQNQKKDSLVPVKIDQVPPKDQALPDQAGFIGLEKPPASKLLDTLVGSMSKGKDSEAQTIAHVQKLNAADEEVKVAVGRKLQHYIGPEWSFLPWEKSRYFQDLQEVSELKVEQHVIC